MSRGFPIPTDWPLADRAFHLVDRANWESVQRDGLHSARALLRRC